MPKKKQIIFFFPYLNPVGVEKAMLRLAGDLAKAGQEIILFQLYREWSNTSDLPKGVMIYQPLPLLAKLPLPRFGLGFKVSMVFLSLVVVIFGGLFFRKFRSQTILAGFLTSSLLLSLKVWRLKICCVVTAQGFPRDSLMRRVFWKGLFKECAAIVAESAGVKGKLVQISGISPDKVVVIHNPHSDQEACKSNLDIPSHPWYEQKSLPIIVSAGRLTKQKDYPTLLKAFAELIKVVPSRLIILGDGEEKVRLKSLSEALELAEYMMFLGYQSNPYAYIKHADVFVLSSKWEGLTRSLVEAIELDVPVVATACDGGPTEILLDGAGGFLSPIGDASALAENLKIALTDKSIVSDKMEAAKQGLSRFSSAETANKYRLLLQQVGTV